ncbi:hypothetical protein [Streptomyces sp. NPDC001675]
MKPPEQKRTAPVRQPRPLAPRLTGEARTHRAEAEQWMLQATDTPHTAAMEWTTHQVALLTAGRVWDAVRLPYVLLRPDFERDTRPEELRRRVAELQVEGAMFCDPYRPFLYVLVPPGTDRRWPDDLAPAGVECMGGTAPYIRHVGVPRLDLLAPPGLFWLVPPDSGGRRLADAQHLYEVLRACAPELSRPTPRTP